MIAAMAWVLEFWGFIAIVLYAFIVGLELGKREGEKNRLKAIHHLMGESYKLGREEKLRLFLSSPDEMTFLDMIKARVHTNIFTDGRDN